MRKQATCERINTWMAYSKAGVLWKSVNARVSLANGA